MTLQRRLNGHFHPLATSASPRCANSSYPWQEDARDKARLSPRRFLSVEWRGHCPLPTLRPYNRSLTLVPYGIVPYATQDRYMPLTCLAARSAAHRIDD